MPDFSSEPESDVSIVKGSIDDYEDRNPDPSDVAFVAEIGLTSLAADRQQMARIYGGGISVYWIVNLVDRQLEVYSNPVDGVYSPPSIFREPQSVTLRLSDQQIGPIAAVGLMPSGAKPAHTLDRIPLACRPRTSLSKPHNTGFLRGTHQNNADWNLPMFKKTRIHSLFAPGLLQQYLDAVLAAELTAASGSSSGEFDRALDREQRSELALRQFVKMANGQDVSMPVTQPVAVNINGALVVVAACPDDAWQEMVLIVDPVHIARGEDC